MRIEKVGGIHPKTPWNDITGGDGMPWVDFHPTTVYIPMCQGENDECTPEVAVRDRVRIGTRVGKAPDKKSVNIHSGVSGTVVAIVEQENPVSGKEEKIIVIENDGAGDAEPDDGLGDDAAPDRETLAGILQDKGLVGMGGAAFPSHGKIAKDADLDILIANGCECEPHLGADATLMEERGEAVLDGIRLVAHAMKIGKTVIAIEDDKPDAIARMRALIGSRPEVLVVPVPKNYPMGGEKQVVLAMTGKEIPSGKLPSDVGALVYNVATLAAISDAVRHGRPLTHRVASVIGDVAVPQNIRFPIGSRARDVIAFCGGWSGTPGRLVLGGPMMGKTSASEDAILLKEHNGLLLINTDHDLFRDERPCIRCNRCSQVCPMRLMPQFLDRAARREKWDECKRLKVKSCINCGCCTYVCPSYIPLAANITKAGKTVKQMAEEKK